MEREHASRDRDSNAAGATLNDKPVPVLAHLLHLHDDISRARRREGKIGTRWGVGALLALDALVKLLHQGRPAIRGRVSQVLFLQFGPDVLLQLRFHGQGPELELGARVENMAVGHTCEHTWNPFLGVDLVQVQVLGAPVDGLEAVRLNRPAGTRLDEAIGLEDVCDGGASLVGLAFQEMEQVARQGLVQGNSILVLAVQSGCLILLDMLGQRDRRQHAQRLLVGLVEMRPQGLEEVLGIVGVALRYQLQV